MVFPHSYTNMPGCLAAITFGCAGPHATFTGGENGERAAECFAQERIADGTADEMALICLEEPFAMALPDGLDVQGRCVVRCFGRKR